MPQRKQTNLNTLLTYPAAQWLPTIVAIVTESNNKWECFLNHVGTILYKLGGLNPTLIETEMCVIRTKKKKPKKLPHYLRGSRTNVLRFSGSHWTIW